MDAKKIDLFENYAIPKAVANLAIPCLLGCIVMIIYNIADTYFVGLLGSETESAAVSLAAPLLLAFNAITNLFGVGGSSMMSRSLGKKDYDTVKKTASFSFYSALFCAVLISAVYTVFRGAVLADGEVTGFLKLIGADFQTGDATSRYLFWTVTCGSIPAICNVVLSNMIRSEGEAMHASIGVMSGCFFNIILDPFFVLPQFLNMGASGAGFATFISNCFSLLYLICVVFKKRKTTCVCLNPMKFCFRKDIFTEVFGVGVPASIQNLLNVTGTLVLNNFTAVYGAAAVSAMGISHKVYLLPVYISMGITQGVMPLISYNFSSGNSTRMKNAIMYVLKLTVGITVALAGVYFIFSGSLIRLFIDVDEIVMHGKILLRAMSIGIPFLAVDFMVVAVFQAIGKGKYSLIFAIMRKIVLEIPAIIVLNKIYPLYGMGYSQAFAEFVLAFCAIFMLKKIFRECNA